MPIRFGTSGWRAVIADEFDFENVRRVVNAICGSLKIDGNAKAGTIVIGHDSRFMGEKFAEIAAEIAVAKGFRVLMCVAPTPTPTISFAIRSNAALGAINFTASHNPPEYQGIKFSTADGAPALPEVTGEIEQRIDSGDAAADVGGGLLERLDPRRGYLDDLRLKVRFDVIERARGRYAFDPLWGTGRGYLDLVLRDHGLEVETIHDWRDVTFGGQAPEPGEEHLGDLRDTVRRGAFTLGLSTDGDSDRFGVIDKNGSFITPNQLITLLTDYLAESRGWQKGAARSVATTHMIDRVAEKRGIKLFETPVGFKYIGELINADEIAIGGEESAGLSIRGHYPEKDGILACLLAAECVAARGASLSDQLEEIYRVIGRLESGRIGVKLSADVSKRLAKRLAEDPTSIGGRTVRNINRLDGVKFIFDDGNWMLMRPSGTEPVVRIYAESESQSELEILLENGRRYLLG